MTNGKDMEATVHICRMNWMFVLTKVKLQNMGYDLDALTQEQYDYCIKFNKRRRSGVIGTNDCVV